MKNAIWAVVVCFAVLALAGPAMTADQPPEQQPAWMTKEYKETISGKNANLAEITKSGKTLIIFMNSACGACRGEMVFLNQLKDEKKFKLVAFNVDAVIKKERVEAYINSEQLKDVPFYEDSEFSLPPVFGFSYTPGSVLFVNGVKTATFGGYNAEVKDKIKAALK